jgi:uncharacterized protein (DUF983 family)
MNINKDLFWGALKGKCPKCQKAPMFGKFLEVRKTCPNCNLDLAKSDVGDGAVFFAIVFVGLIVTVLAVKLDSLQPLNLYAHILLWTPVTIVAAILTLRIFKSLLIWMQYELRKEEFNKEK